MAKSKKATTTPTRAKAKPTNSTNKNRTVTKSDVSTAKKIIKQQLTKTENFVNQSKQAAKNKSFAEAFSNNSLEEKKVVVDTPKQAVRPPKFEDFKPIGSLVPFRSFLPEGYVVYININCITSVQNYTTHTDSVQIGLVSGLTQLVKHSISEVLSIISENN